MTALKVTKLGFDYLENRSPEYIIEEQIFTDSPERNRMLKASDYITGQKVKLYLSYTKEVYPKFVVTEININ